MPGGAELRDLTLVEAAAAIRDGDVTSEAVTRACLDEIERVAPALNCFIRVDGETALERAAACDRARRAGRPLGALHGVPLAHKDMFYRGGAVVSCGSRILADFRPAENSVLLARLEEAGALNLGALHMAEFAMSPMGYNAHLGHGRNPWNPAHVSGGSSSGSGAATAARLVFGALGSDTGGSVRMPAAICGVTGLKPTQGRLPLGGAMPLAPSLDCAGFLARSAADITCLMGAATGDGEMFDAIAAGRPSGSGGIVVAVPDLDAADGPMTEEIRSIVRHAADDLRAAGAVLRPVPMPDLAELGLIANVILGSEAAAIHRPWLESRPGDYGRQVRRRIERGLLYPATRYIDALRLRGPLLADFLARYLDSGAAALLLPVLPEPVPAIEETTAGSETEIEERFGSFSYWTRAINYLGLPSLALPAGFTGNGLPTGIQLVGRPLSEPLLLRIGRQFQEVTDWHRRKPRL